jgi:hypothetical protein
MRKQARRLWFGDWRGDEEPAHAQGAAADHDDTVVITPEDVGDEQAAEHRRSIQRRVIGVAAVALLAAIGFAISSGRDDTSLVSEQAQTPPAQIPQAQPQVPQVPPGPPPQGFGGPDLTGADAQRAARAALAQYPGDIERVTRGPTGDGYVVHVFEADGNEVHVVVDDQFKVQGSDANRGPRGFGSGRSQ